MPAIKNKIAQQDMTGPSLSTVRKQIRRKLIEVGLQMKGNDKKIQNLKPHKYKSKEGNLNKDNLPLLKSQRRQNVPLSDFKYIFSQHQDHFSHRESPMKFSNQILQGKRYHHTVDSSRETTLQINKQILIGREIDTVKQNQDGLIPWLRKFQIYKNSKSSNTQPLSIARLFLKKNIQMIKKQFQEVTNRRSKTEQRQVSKHKLLEKKKYIRYKQISPWQFQIARDTIINFQ